MADWIYGNIATHHQQTADFLRKYGAWDRVPQADRDALNAAYQNVQAHATDSSAWQAVGNAHTISDKLLKKGLAPNAPSIAIQKELETHFIRLSDVMPGGKTWAGNVIRTFGTAFKDAANWTGTAFKDISQSPLWKVAAGVAVFIPGIGPAVSAGMLTAAAIGKAASSNPVVNAAKEALSSDAAKSGFEIGMGLVVKGGGMSESTFIEARNQVPNGDAKIGFDAAINLGAGAATSTTTGLTPREKEALQNPQAKATFLATSGLVKFNAPGPMKVAVSKAMVKTTEAQKGLYAAVNDMGGREISWLEWIWHEIKNTGAKVTSIIQPKPKTIVTVRGERLQ